MQESCKQILWVGQEGKKINSPLSGKQFSFLPATPFSPSRTHDGLFELTQRPSGALDSALRCYQNYRETRTSSGVPRLSLRSQHTVCLVGTMRLGKTVTLPLTLYMWMCRGFVSFKKHIPHTYSAAKSIFLYFDKRNQWCEPNDWAPEVTLYTYQLWCHIYSNDDVTANAQSFGTQHWTQHKNNRRKGNGPVLNWQYRILR